MDTLGVVECATIAAGVEVADQMMKVADVELLRANTICSGRYMIYVSGDRDAVKTSVQSAKDSGRKLHGSYVISNVCNELISALKKSRYVESVKALGIVECKKVSPGIVAADEVLKGTNVSLAKFVTGQGINGKSYFVISGDVASVEEAAEIAKKVLGKNLIDTVVIPRPDVSVARSLVSGLR